ncbi:ABC transporter [Aspergillus alliaceus]|uniref:ABC transporter n=1 Tax=Petromyces alliaceus TaxID=209559 RepID=UPI0012A73077|nr:ABC transporter [Aspergillus alliaceus]KAB8236980.1 ABC transporter [Aspergillus alliaceus]
MRLLSNITPRSASCSILVENQFGPSVERCYNGFDFTLLFEEGFMSIAPSSIFFLAAIARILYLQNQEPKVIKEWLYWTKVLLHATNALVQLVQLCLWARPSMPRTDLSLAASCLSLVAIVGFGCLSHYEHCRSIRPSKSLNCFFLFTILLYIPRLRTLWAIEGLQAVAAMSIVSAILSLLLLGFEMAEKKHILSASGSAMPPETWAGAFNRGLFWWLNPLLQAGSKKTLTLNDLFPMQKTMVPEPAVVDQFSRLWDRYEAQDQWQSLVGPLLNTLKWDLLAGIIPRLAQIGFTFAQPYLIRSTVTLLITQGTNARSRGLGLIAAYTIVYVGQGISSAQTQHKSYRLMASMRGILVTMIYRKVMTMPIHSGDDASAITAMNTDVDRVTAGFQHIHETWATFIELPLCLWLLYLQISSADVAPILISFCSTVVVAWLAGIASVRQKLWVERIQQRLGVTSEMVSAIKSVKMSALTGKLSTKLHALRENEISISYRYRLLLIVLIALANINTIITPVVSFTIYTIMSQSKSIGVLNSERLFTSLTLFNIFAGSFMGFLQAFADLATSLGCTGRIQNFLAQSRRHDLRISRVSTPSQDSDTTCKLGSETPCIEAHNLTVWWKRDRPPILRNQSFVIPQSSLTMVVGTVGCGKSTLLQALLGEVPFITGEVRVDSARIAYCSQTPWLANGTLKENILGAEGYVEEWYLKVIAACGLQDDLKQLHQGDQTLIGSNGISLSGGQKQRLALARAIYSQISVMLLDDITSSIDAVTEERILSQVLGPQGLTRMLGVTVVMTTNSTRALPLADHIIVLNAEGSILAQGQFAHVQDYLHYTHNQERKMKPSTAVMEATAAPSAQHHVLDSDEKNIEQNCHTGLFTTYKYYLSTAPICAWCVFYMSLAIYVFLQVFPTVWLKWWAADNDKQPNVHWHMRVGVYWCLGILGIAFLMFTAWYHSCLTLNHLSKGDTSITSFSFLEQFSLMTDNLPRARFSQDLELIDFELPIVTLNTSLALFLCIGQLIVISVSAKYITATLPACLVAYYCIQRYYIRTSRQLRVMEIEARSPLFTNFMETTVGLATIRAFGWQKEYKAINQTCLHNSQKPYYLLLSIQMWLSVVLDMSIAGFVVVLMGIAVATMGHASPSSIGLALVNVASLSTSIKNFIAYWTSLETSLGAITRVKDFVEGTRSEHLPGETFSVPEQWPNFGSIEFRAVSASYNQSDLAMKNVSLTIRQGEKIAICGRTGSGKSTLISTLFRTVEIIDGRILVDDLDIATIPRERVRSSIIGIPQDPYVFDQSSVRENVDPYSKHSNESIIDVLKKVRLWSLVEAGGGLDIVVSPDIFSDGQRQILCLARAMLRDGNIVAFDEVTSRIDRITDDFMQDAIRHHFKDHTVLTVTHRLDTIMLYERVLMMHDGALIADGPPTVLLHQCPEFRDMYDTFNDSQVP